MDPLFKGFPWSTPYSFAENDLIRNVDLDGGEKQGYQYKLRLYFKVQGSVGIQAKAEVHLLEALGLGGYLSGPASEGTTIFHVDYYLTDKVWDAGYFSASKDVQTAAGFDLLKFGKTKSYEKNTSTLDENENPIYPEPYKVQITEGSPIYEETSTNYKKSDEKMKFSLVNVDIRLILGLGTEVTMERTEVPIGAGNDKNLNSNSPAPIPLVKPVPIPFKGPLLPIPNSKENTVPISVPTRGAATPSGTDVKLKSTTTYNGG